MKFIFADSLDMVDPNYDFLEDRSRPGREPYWDDLYAHEFFERPPYDGVLVSRGIVGDHIISGKYSEGQQMRFRRIGARRFLRMTGPKYRHMDVFGDCGAFTYADHDVPPYTPENMLEFYHDGKFTHGCSVDHIIFEFDPMPQDLKGGSAQAKFRFDLTQENAGQFLKRSKRLGRQFKPIGAVQGWSPASMAIAAKNLEKMGYDYLALGGMVPLSADSIRQCLQAIREKIHPRTKLHILGFAKAEQIGQFAGYGIASFDSTSPLIRAFKDAKANYYIKRHDGQLDYYAAVRVPQATENPRLTRKSREGKLDQEQLVRLEKHALDSLRRFDVGKLSLAKAVESVIEYSQILVWDEKKSTRENKAAVEKSKVQIVRTLTDKPWKQCSCRVCREAGIEVIIFRSSNRNKRRGFHNLDVYYNHVRYFH